MTQFRPPVFALLATTALALAVLAPVPSLGAAERSIEDRLADMTWLLNQHRQVTPARAKRADQLRTLAATAARQGNWGKAYKGYAESLLDSPSAEGLLGLAEATACQRYGDRTKTERTRNKRIDLRRSNRFTRAAMGFNARLKLSRPKDMADRMTRILSCLDRGLGRDID